MASIEAMTPMIVARMPALSQVGVLPGGGGFGHQAAEAGRFAGQDRQRLAFGAQAAAVDPRNAELDGRVVEQEPRLEIVGAIDQAIDAVQQPLDVRVIDIGDDRFDFDLGIDLRQPILGRDRLGQAGGHVVLVVEHLPLQVVQLQEVAIDDPQLADAGPGQRVGDHRAERPAADDQRPRSQQLLLPRATERRKPHLAGIAAGLRVERVGGRTSHGSARMKHGWEEFVSVYTT